MEWDHYLDDVALRVLREWDGCIERIVYRHSARPYSSVALKVTDAMERQLVKVEDTDMCDDYWKHV